jgi:hypothetical protein
MGIASLLSTLVKGVGWTKVAELAAEYGPDIYRKARERFRQEPAPAPAVSEESELGELRERLERLEKLLLEQDEVIRQQTAKNESLETARLELEKELTVMRIVAGVLTLGCIILLSVLFK